MKFLKLISVFVFFILSLSTQADFGEYAPFERPGTYFDMDQGVMVDNNGIRYWHVSSNKVLSDNGLTYKMGLFRIKSSDGKRYRKLSSSKRPDEWSNGNHPVTLSKKTLTFRENNGTDMGKLSQAISNGDSIYLSDEERDTLSAYLSLRDHDEDNWDGSFRNQRS